MAQLHEVRLVDDLDGRPADETVSFHCDGSSYEIDLSSEHARQLREALTPFIAAARPTAPGNREASALTRQQRAAREHNQSVRDWARRRNVHINRRGRIPEQIKRGYDDEAAMSGLVRSEAVMSEAVMSEAVMSESVMSESASEGRL
ncbi:MAG: hypothetical protein QOF99_1486 [Pseudonocardiales bacterium]|nr:hypothetical protein [Pseudonocardiales bacterium]